MLISSAYLAALISTVLNLASQWRFAHFLRRAIRRPRSRVREQDTFVVAPQIGQQNPFAGWAVATMRGTR